MDNNLEEEEEEKLMQMIQDFIESESSSSNHSSSCSASYSECSGSQLTLMKILGSGTDEFQREMERKVMDRVEKHMKKMKDIRGSELKKWMALNLKMDGFTASLCHNSWVSTFSGDYEYINIRVDSKLDKRRSDDEDEPLRLILDLDFRSQFELARPTETYKALTDSLPAIFIGDAVKLNGVISLLCSAAKKSLKDRGLHIPPWRTVTYMQSKWLHSPTGDGGGETAEVVVSRRMKWVPPPPASSVWDRRKKGLGNGGSSGLSTQFSNMRINCC